MHNLKKILYLHFIVLLSHTNAATPEFDTVEYHSYRPSLTAVAQEIREKGISHFISRIKLAQTENDAILQVTLSDAFQFNEYHPSYADNFALMKERYVLENGMNGIKRPEQPIYETAAKKGFLPAILWLKQQEWTRNRDSAFAATLYPFVNKGCVALDYQFGLALRDGFVRSSTTFYEGMCWIEKTFGFDVRYDACDVRPAINPNGKPSPIGRLEIDRTSGRQYASHAVHFTLDGLMHIVGTNVIYAPAIEHWEEFKRTKLAPLRDKPFDPAVFLSASADTSAPPMDVMSLLRKTKHRP